MNIVTGTWKDGRTATFHGLRDAKHDYGALLYGTKNITPVTGFDGYEPLVVEIAKFFKTRKPPVSAEETIELFTFMEAADESKRRGGVPVTVASVIERARAEIARSEGK